MQDFEKYSRYVDLVWKRKNNKTAFIVLDDDQHINKNINRIEEIFDI